MTTLNQQQSEKMLMELERKAYKRTKARDLRYMQALHAKDALMFPPGSESQLASDVFNTALAAQEAQSQQLKEETAPVESNVKSQADFFWEPVSAQVSASDDMGWVHGVITITDEQGSKQYGKYVSVWVKEDGKWKVAAEIRNNN